ncbi:MAG TPA: Crp/Fnr family transcriptional regulator [Bacteroides mediterraneensis]|jgi:CRP-like cAMP-binding protein|uniref:Crp/Fnr family transcriptional regulator n=1 Tax=Bacteroides mediterraneensis TaxID=1841856 RepID=UPI0026EF0599|nr:Crp/Fnr family transcriptional regulator [Bacteroides mediterraneensis]HJH64970.1 Crp/Fnr family transcriptional regulator [Bacteroides mediterraneensis]
MKTFSEILHEKYGLSASESEQLLAQMERLTYRKGEHIVREGERNSSLYLVAQGIWRGHYLRDGVDISLWFASEGDTLFSSWSYVADRPSLTSIEAMSDSTVFRISKQKMETFFASSIAFANIGRVIFERQFLDMENWMINGGAAQAKQRYLALLEQNPELLQHVPLKHIASYLMITPQSLSRIRAELSRKK